MKVLNPLIVTVVFVISGCTHTPADLGLGDVDELTSARGLSLDAAASEAQTRKLLASLLDSPLTAESAVRIALMNNPDLHSTLATLGFGAADVYEAGRIRNPVFSGAFLDPDSAGERDLVTLGLVTSFTDLITRPVRKRLSIASFAALKESIGAEVMAMAAGAEKAYYEYIGAQQVAALRRQMGKAGALSAALAQRFRDAGNLTLRELALENAAASEARLLALEAESAAYKARTELATILGLSVDAPWTAPTQLGLPLNSEDDLQTLVALALKCRLDLAAARTSAEVQADQLGVTHWTRWLGDLDIGIERERETDGARLQGPTIDWEVPIFNQHNDAVLRARTELKIAVNDVRRLAIDIDNEVRLAYTALANTRARIFEYRDVLIPQRVETVARAQEEVNFMLIGIFELIALKQEEYDAYENYLSAIRDYWITRADLSLAVGAALPSSARIGQQHIDVEEFIRPQTGGMDHSGHGSMDGKPMNMKNPGSDEMDHSGHSSKGDKPMNMKSPGTGEMDHSGHRSMGDKPMNMKNPGSGELDHSGHGSMSDKSMNMKNPGSGEMDHTGHGSMDARPVDPVNTQPDADTQLPQQSEHKHQDGDSQ